MRESTRSLLPTLLTAGTMSQGAVRNDEKNEVHADGAGSLVPHNNNSAEGWWELPTRCEIISGCKLS